jgi:hypothetical protein
MELADMSLLEFPREEGPTPCFALIFLLSNGKTNKTGKKQFMGALRHHDPLLCTQGALAQYLFWRWHISGEQPPSFQRRQNWYRTKMLVGRHKNEAISYPTQLEDVYRAFLTAGVTSVKKTHAMRGCGARGAELHSVSEKQVSLVLLIIYIFSNLELYYRFDVLGDGTQAPSQTHT